ncbi:MAG: M23 family metallopeptidase [Chitinophagales bacterium]
MKNKIKIFTAICLLLSCVHLSAQEAIEMPPDKIPGCDGPMPQQTIYLDENNKIAQDMLKKKQTQTDGVAMATGGFLAWPLRMTADYEGINGVYSYFFVSNYIDQFIGDFYADGVRGDWRCFEGEDARNYDDHNGADIVPYPFSWQMMDDESLDVIAAADGVVLDVYDINSFDRNCDTPHVFIISDTLLNHGYGGNWIRIQHFDADLTQTIYAHLKHGSLADIHPGDTVRQGDYLGKIGSAGNSSGPHLHFEVHQYSAYEGGWHLVEPWDDPGTYGETDCNPWLDNSLWINQLPYYNKQLIRITTHDASPVFKSCTAYESGSNEDVNITNHFSAASMKIRIAIRDPEAGDHIDIDIYTSTGTLKSSIDYDVPTSRQIEDYEWTQSIVFWANDTYRIRVTYDGKTYDHYFTVGCSGDKIYSGAQSGHKGFISGGSINSTSTISGKCKQCVISGRNICKVEQ